MVKPSSLWTVRALVTRSFSQTSHFLCSSLHLHVVFLFPSLFLPCCIAPSHLRNCFLSLLLDCFQGFFHSRITAYLTRFWSHLPCSSTSCIVPPASPLPTTTRLVKYFYLLFFFVFADVIFHEYVNLYIYF